MSICINNNCYEQITTDDAMYFIRSLVYSNELNEKTDPIKLTQISDFVFDIVKDRRGIVHELMKRPQ